MLPRPPGHVVILLLICWAAFCWGALGHYVEVRDEGFGLWTALVLVLAPPAAVFGAWLLRRKWESLTRPVVEMLARHTEAVEGLGTARLRLLIALAAGLGLFAELALIRLHASQFQLFAYFKNVSLLSCFLGLGLGYARSGRGALLTPLVLPALALQLAFLSVLRTWRDAPFLQNPIPERFSLGMYDAQTLNAVVAVFGFIGLVFAFNALCFVPLGQLAGRLMMRLGKLESYGWNLLGSLLGILLFNAVSFLWAPPLVWILLVALMLLPFLAANGRAVALAMAAAALALGVLGWSTRLDAYDVYSPYQRLTVALARGGQPPEIQVSNVYYQRMLDLSSESVADNDKLEHAAQYYSLPYRFKSDAERVVIVGSGTGNDVAAALRHGVREIDAVEIDPAILALGKRFHPEAPYASERVRAINDDARSFLRTTEKKYDLVVYGLLDSHTLLSGISSVRLDSFVYTVEAFREARARLADGGLISMTFSAAHPLLAKKIFLMLREAFDGSTPLVLHSFYDYGVSFLIGEDSGQLRKPADVPFQDLTPTLASDDLSADVSTDDWPFFYMPVRRYPVSYLAMVVLLVFLSAVFVLRLAPGGGRGFSAPCFFLGAGFMLVETKGITELALVYGSTWMVIGTVIAAILIMAYLANLVVLHGKAPPVTATYVLLIASLLLGLFLVGADLADLPVRAVQLLLTAALTLPLFFSGMAFSEEIERTGTVATAMASNLLGAMMGGLLEYNSMYFGFRSLYFLAMAMYVLAFVGTLRRR